MSLNFALELPIQLSSLPRANLSVVFIQVGFMKAVP